MEPRPWSVTALNLPEHRHNPIHTDAGARAEGFPAALVAGVTTYVYLTHPIVEAWGRDWLERGGCEMRFRAPVFADRTVDVVPSPVDDGSGDVSVEANDQLENVNPRALIRAFRDAGPPQPRRDGEELPSLRIAIEGQFGADHGARAGDDLPLYVDEGIVHPAVWPSLANRVYSTHLIDGAWVHTRSIVRHHAIAPVGVEVDVDATVVERFDRHGERAVCDIEIELDGRTLVTIEHEAIVRMP